MRRMRGRTWEVDVYSGDNEGLVIAEIELESETDAGGAAALGRTRGHRGGALLRLASCDAALSLVGGRRAAGDA